MSAPSPPCPGGRSGNYPVDIETALRAASGQAYLVANTTTAGFEIVLGEAAWHAALADAGVTIEQNWAALSTRR